MQNDRFRVPHQAKYIEALGLAAFCFARCEWDASYCCEKLKPGYLTTIEAGRKTAGKIASDFHSLVATLTDHILRVDCEYAAKEFSEIVRLRNDLLHGKPCTALNGDQALSGAQGIWTIELIEDFADRATACQSMLNNILQNRLT